MCAGEADGMHDFGVVRETVKMWFGGWVCEVNARMAQGSHSCPVKSIAAGDWEFRKLIRSISPTRVQLPPANY